MNLAATIFNDGAMSQHGDQPALLCGDRCLTYIELSKLVGRYGNALQTYGLGPGQLVVLLLRDTPELVATFFGAMRIGVTPIIVAHRSTRADLESVLRECGAETLVYEAGREELSDAPSHLRRLTAEELATRAQDVDPERSPPFARGDGEAFWVFSSGSTGRSKGVIHHHRKLDEVTEYHRSLLGISPGTRVYCTSRLSFAYGLGNGLLAPLFLGATIILDPDWPTPASTLGLISEQLPNVIFSTPSLYRAWLNLPSVDGSVFAHAHLISAGERLSVRLRERWRQRFGNDLRDCYGCSETIFFVFASTTSGQPSGAVGKLVPGATAMLQALGRSGRVNPGEVGRLYIRHPFLAERYSAGATAQQGRFRDGWFETGDLFECDSQGYWTYRGRDDDLLKVAGQWVNLKELEDVANEFSDVAVSAAIPIEDQDGMERVALFVTPDPSSGNDDCSQRLTEFLAERLRPHQRPKWIRVVADMPRTSTGKIQKRALSRYMTGVPK